MLTTWAKRILSTFPHNSILPGVSIAGNSTTPCFTEVKDINGDTKYIDPMYYGSTVSLISTVLSTNIMNPTYGFAVGSDDSPESENDYTLGNQIIGLTGTSIAYTTVYDTENHKYISRTTITISNNTGTEVTIKEIGKFTGHFSTDTQGSTGVIATKTCVMIDRTVLDNPVVIPDGEAGVIVYDVVLG